MFSMNDAKAFAENIETVITSKLIQMQDDLDSLNVLTKAQRYLRWKISDELQRRVK